METTTTSPEIVATSCNDIVTRSFNEFSPYITNYISSKINNRCDAEDLAQDVFVRLMDYKQMLRPETVKSFLFTIARNIVIDYLRRQYKKQEISANMFEFMPTFVNDIESKLHEKEILSLERTMLSTFSPQRRNVYMLCRYDEKSVPEISQKLNISLRTVESHLYTGRRIMRKYIKACV
jgi:RNA polymerase sigma-70 factor (ECF subfamily)